MASLQLENKAGIDSPSGTIIVWTDLISTIPTGWSLCDGSGGTPDLRTRFCREVPTAGTNPGATGGVATVALTTGNMSNHLHSGTGTSHNHEAEWTANTGGATANMPLGGGNATVQSIPQGNSTKIADPVQVQGGNGAHNNLPTFREVLFIQKD